LRDLGGNVLPYSLQTAASISVQSSSLVSLAVAGGMTDQHDPVVVLSLSLGGLNHVSIAVQVGGEVVGAGGNFTVFVKAAQCAEGRMEAVAGGLDCHCPGGLYENKGVCVSCPAGTYKLQPGNASQSSCIPCPSGYFCLEGQPGVSGKCPVRGFDCSQGKLRLKDGFWIEPVMDDWNDGISLTVTECVNMDACLGSEVTGNSTIGFQGRCAEGYVGRGCDTCSVDFAGLSGYCTKCYGPSMSTVAVVLMQAAVVLSVGFLVALVLEETRGVSKVRVC
jgi:Tyrosine-protein kinase ephrin type A/B receptor-like